MLTLTLFRHAKSSWDFPELDDFDRPLSKRGESAAPKMADCLARHDLVPDMVICSASRRTRDTTRLLLSRWQKQPRIAYSQALYHATVPEHLRLVRETPDEVRHLILVGHNPGLEAFALQLIGSGETRQWAALAGKFPTAAFAVIRFDTEPWTQTRYGTGQLIMFTTPKLVEAT
jgi:phosphohistidine phosphatase